MNIKVVGDPDYGTLEQFHKVCQRDNVVQAALMPDAHVGYTMPIGGVALVDKAVYPSWVGYDIGCGVCAIRVETDSFSTNYVMNNNERLLYSLMSGMPTDKHNNPVSPMPTTIDLSKAASSLLLPRSAAKQLGTLGGGNHFLEIAYDENDWSVWIVIHSGSRGIGHGIAGYWMEQAKELSGRTDGMDSFQFGTDNYDKYIADQQWCIRYALENRLAMLKRVENLFNIHLNWDTLINKVHNVALETADGVLHRKGATDASLGTYGVIPGNMGVGSAIVKGLGNAEALNSCSHGAGRAYARGKAKRELSLETFEKDTIGVACRVDASSLDESPAAYKNFDVVMSKQMDLCSVERYLKPLVNFKG